MEIREEDLRIDVFSNMAGGAVRITWLPPSPGGGIPLNGAIVVTKTFTRRGEAGYDAQSQIQARELAMAELRERLTAL